MFAESTIEAEQWRGMLEMMHDKLREEVIRGGEGGRDRGRGGREGGREGGVQGFEKEISDIYTWENLPIALGPGCSLIER